VKKKEEKKRLRREMEVLSLKNLSLETKKAASCASQGAE
jgi:hypothetical protein